MTEEALDETSVEETGEVVEEVTEATETEITEPSESSTENSVEEPEKEPEKDNIQKRIDELTFKRYEAEREAEYLRQQLQQTQKVEPEPLKTLEDFNYDETAFQQHLLNEAQKGAVEKAREVLREEQLLSQRNEKKFAFESKETLFAQENPDYFAKTRDQNNLVSQAMVEATESMDNGAEIRYYLANNPTVARNLYYLSPVQTAVELGKIDARLEQAKSVKPKKVSDAKPPTPKIAAGDPANEKKLADIESQSEFEARRRKFIANRG